MTKMTKIVSLQALRQHTAHVRKYHPLLPPGPVPLALRTALEQPWLFSSHASLTHASLVLPAVSRMFLSPYQNYTLHLANYAVLKRPLVKPVL